jgi:hypothetical protein
LWLHLPSFLLVDVTQTGLFLFIATLAKEEMASNASVPVAGILAGIFAGIFKINFAGGFTMTRSLV